MRYDIHVEILGYCRTIVNSYPTAVQRLFRVIRTGVRPGRCAWPWISGR